jgi:hypothetical protein
MKYFDDLIFHSLRQPLFTIEEAEQKLHQDVACFPPEYSDKDAISGEVVN